MVNTELITGFSDKAEIYGAGAETCIVATGPRFRLVTLCEKLPIGAGRHAVFDFLEPPLANQDAGLPRNKEIPAFGPNFTAVKATA